MASAGFFPNGTYHVHIDPHMHVTFVGLIFDRKGNVARCGLC